MTKTAYRKARKERIGKAQAENSRASMAFDQETHPKNMHEIHHYIPT